MSSNFRGPRALDGFWKRRSTSPVPSLDDDYPPPARQGSALKTILLWAGAALGLVVLLGLVLVVPGLVF